ncbi:MAG: hypothetical protein L0206_03845, partial [Actinobacteria bacterium]|nr:hypothetical protein [Actinomycetota bacterium]
FRLATRVSAIAAAAGFVALGAAGCGAARTAEVAAGPDRAGDPLVEPLAAEDLDQFEVVDMADAVERVSGVEVAAQGR